MMVLLRVRTGVDRTKSKTGKPTTELLEVDIEIAAEGPTSPQSKPCESETSVEEEIVNDSSMAARGVKKASRIASCDRRRQSKNWDPDSWTAMQEELAFSAAASREEPPLDNEQQQQARSPPKQQSQSRVIDSQSPQNQQYHPAQFQQPQPQNPQLQIPKLPSSQLQDPNLQGPQIQNQRLQNPQFQTTQLLQNQQLQNSQYQSAEGHLTDHQAEQYYPEKDFSAQYPVPGQYPSEGFNGEQYQAEHPVPAQNPLTQNLPVQIQPVQNASVQSQPVHNHSTPAPYHTPQEHPAQNQPSLTTGLLGQGLGAPTSQAQNFQGHTTQNVYSPDQIRQAQRYYPQQQKAAHQQAAQAEAALQGQSSQSPQTPHQTSKGQGKGQTKGKSKGRTNGKAKCHTKVQVQTQAEGQMNNQTENQVHQGQIQFAQENPRIPQEHDQVPAEHGQIPQRYYPIPGQASGSQAQPSPIPTIQQPPGQAQSQFHPKGQVISAAIENPAVTQIIGEEPAALAPVTENPEREPPQHLEVDESYKRIECSHTEWSSLTADVSNGFQKIHDHQHSKDIDCAVYLQMLKEGVPPFDLGGYIFRYTWRPVEGQLRPHSDKLPAYPVQYIDLPCRKWSVERESLWQGAKISFERHPTQDPPGCFRDEEDPAVTSYKSFVFQDTVPLISYERSIPPVSDLPDGCYKYEMYLNMEYRTGYEKRCFWKPLEDQKGGKDSKDEKKEDILVANSDYGPGSGWGSLD